MNVLALISIVFLAVSTSTAPKPRVTFSSPGQKTVTLTVCNARGCSTATKIVEVLDPRPTILSTTYPTKVGSAEVPVTLTSRLSGRPPLLSTWTIRDPLSRSTVLSRPNATWWPQLLGSHQAQLTVTSGSGSATTGPVSVEVLPSSFSDVSPASPYSSFIETLAGLGIAAGCAESPPRFCPASTISRAEIAVLLRFSMIAAGIAPAPPAAVGLFLDVPATHWAAPSIEDLYRRGVTGGCNLAPPLFCPLAPVTRAQVAVLLLRSLYGGSYVPPPPRGRFLDVPLNSPYAPYVEEMAALGITGGCSAQLFCPEDLTNRAQIAVFLVQTFRLTPRPIPVRFKGGLCPGVCAYSTSMPLPFTLDFQGGVPSKFEYDWNGDGTFEEVSATPVSVHSFPAGTFRPAVRLRAGTYLSPIFTHPPLTFRAPDFTKLPPSPTGLQLGPPATLPLLRSETPGTLPRTAFAISASAINHDGFLVYFAPVGLQSQLLGVLPAQLAGARVVTPTLPAASRGSIFLRAFNQYGLGNSSTAVSITFP